MQQEDMFVEQSRKVLMLDSTWPWVSPDILIYVEEHWKDEKGCGWRKWLYSISYYETTEESRKVIYETL